MGDDAEHPRLSASGHHPVDLGGRGGHRLFEVDVAAGFGGVEHELAMVADLARGDNRYVGHFPGEHLAVIGVARFGAGLRERRRPPLLVRVGESCYMRSFDADEPHV